MDLKFSLVIFTRFHGAITGSEKSFNAHLYDNALGNVSRSDPWTELYFTLWFIARVIYGDRSIVELMTYFV